jgi:hypothetical protein
MKGNFQKTIQIQGDNIETIQHYNTFENNRSLNELFYISSHNIEY